MQYRTEPALLRELSQMLRAGGIEDAELEAKWICEDAADAAQAREIAARRAAHEPLQYLLGKWEFYGLPVSVGRGVLIPRADTETLVEAVLQRVPDKKEQRLADLCTGSGCIALALAVHLPQSRIIALEKSPDALRYAVQNTAENGLTDRVCVAEADVLDPAEAVKYRGLTAIVSNPPYLTGEEMLHLQREVQFEPETALRGGADGLRFYRGIAALWRESLMPGGLIAFEIGYRQAAAVAGILHENGYVQIETVRDLSGNERVVLGRRG